MGSVQRRGGMSGEGGRPDLLVVLDVAVATGSAAAAAGSGLARGVAALTAPVTAVVLRPPLVPQRYQPAAVLSDLARRGSARRVDLARRFAAVLDVVVPAVVTELVRRVDLDDLIARNVDLDGLVARVDLDQVTSRVDVDAVAARLDLDAVVSRLDLTRIVAEQVDLDQLVSSVDLDTAVSRVDVDAIARRVDIDAIIERIDLLGLADEVITGIDLPEIIRESTGSVASDTVRGVRMQSISGDQAISRAVDRLRRRRGGGPPRGASADVASGAGDDLGEQPLREETPSTP